MKNKLNEEIVSSIRNRVPPNENIVSFLMDIFSWGKESVYRRLRCEIPFTYEEIVIIASKLNFSIDNIIGSKKSEQIVFDLSIYESTEPGDLYYEKIFLLTKFFNELFKAKSTKSIFAVNYIPYTYSMYFELYTKFNYYKWLHQTHDLPPGCMMSDIEVPAKIVDLRKTWTQENRTGLTAYYILDNNLLLSATRDIDYFYQRELISEVELEVLREELLWLVDGIEMSAKSGVTVTGAEVNLYLSSMDITASHSYFEYDDNMCCHVQIHGIDILQSYYADACLAQKEWVEMLIRYSTLITKSGEMQRFEYCRKQREYILAMGQKY